MYKEIIKYLKDNPKGYWFKSKLYGYGWTPVKWQGWLVLFLFLALIFLNFYCLDVNSHYASDTLLNFIPQTFVLVLLLIFICYKTGEKPKWQWGLPKKK